MSRQPAAPQGGQSVSGTEEWGQPPGYHSCDKPFIVKLSATTLFSKTAVSGTTSSNRKVTTSIRGAIKLNWLTRKVMELQVFNSFHQKDGQRYFFIRLHKSKSTYMITRRVLFLLHSLLRSLIWISLSLDPLPPPPPHPQKK